MKVDKHTILHRKDENGVIVESGVFGPDDDIPKGFGPQEYTPVANQVQMAEIAESKLTPWESPVVYQGLEAQPDDSDEVDDGTPVEARAELTGAEQEALDGLESAEDDSDDENTVDQGSPVQAKEEAGEDLTASEEKPGEEKSGRRRSNRS
jgi:hypothetical protein